jgi:hypothetical protein
MRKAEPEFPSRLPWSSPCFGRIPLSRWSGDSQERLGHGVEVRIIRWS